MSIEQITFRVTDGEIMITDDYARMQTRIGMKVEPFGITVEQLEAYMESLCLHITSVREAGERIGVDRRQLREHDMSKTNLEELPHYVRQFHGDKGDPDGFARAWLNHIHCNPHHWQHWIFPDGYTPKGSTVDGGIVAMPDIYVKEMVADWMGASLAYTNSWDMAEWLGQNLPKIKLHLTSWQTLKAVLRALPEGYHNVLNELQVNGLIP